MSDEYADITLTSNSYLKQYKIRKFTTFYLGIS